MYFYMPIYTEALHIIAATLWFFSISIITFQFKLLEVLKVKNSELKTTAFSNELSLVFGNVE